MSDLSIERIEQLTKTLENIEKIAHNRAFPWFEKQEATNCYDDMEYYGKIFDAIEIECANALRGENS